MNFVQTDRVLTFCWREWRAQRSVLLAYMGMGLAALCLVFLLVPEHWWLEDGRRALALSWFVAIGMIGLIAFVAPALVRSEFGSKNDHFVRRLPGALLPSFGGKLLFLVLASAAMPLVCLLVGQGFLLAIDQTWQNDFFRWDHTGHVYFEWIWPVIAFGYATLMIPWVWAIGTWLPGGRMAIGGVILFALLLGLAGFAVLRQSPGLQHGIDWQGWLWTVPVVGLGVAAISWTKGRRGGGPLRSARYGLLATAIGFLPACVWLTDRVWAYHHPDLQHVVRLYLHGSSPDGRFLLAGGAEHDAFNLAPMRIDLRDGSATQLGACGDYAVLERFRPNTTWPLGVGRYWRFDDYASRSGDRVPCDLLDLTTGERTRLVWSIAQRATELPEHVARVVAAEARELTRLRAPGDRRAWFGRDYLCIDGDAGVVDRVQWEGPLPSYVRACGHGFRAHFEKGSQLFDLTTRRRVDVENGTRYDWLVHGVHLTAKTNGAYRWERRGEGGVATPLSGLDGCGIHGLFDDAHLLCSTNARRSRKPAPVRLFLWRVADGATTELRLPPELPVGASVDAMHPFGALPSLLARDPAGRVWLRATNATADAFVLLDAATLAMTMVKETAAAPRDGRRNRSLLGWPDAESAIVQDGARIERIHAATGERTVLFPRR